MAHEQHTPRPPGRVMVVMAHPDDAEFICGGTIARWAAEGRDIGYVVGTSGDKGKRRSSHDSRASGRDTRT